MHGNILALDLGTITGYALFLGAVDNSMTGVWDLKPKRFEGGGMRYLRFRKYLDEMRGTVGIDEIHFEEVRRHKGTDAAHVYGGLMATLQAWCEEHDVPCAGHPVGEIKKFATGKGNATKDQMIAAAQTFGFEPADDNEADAICIGLMVRARS